MEMEWVCVPSWCEDVSYGNEVSSRCSFLPSGVTSQPSASGVRAPVPRRFPWRPRSDIVGLVEWIRRNGANGSRSPLCLSEQGHSPKKKARPSPRQILLCTGETTKKDLESWMSSLAGRRGGTKEDDVALCDTTLYLAGLSFLSREILSDVVALLTSGWKTFCAPTPSLPLSDPAVSVPVLVLCASEREMQLLHDEARASCTSSPFRLPFPRHTTLLDPRFAVSRKQAVGSSSVGIARAYCGPSGTGKTFQMERDLEEERKRQSSVHRSPKKSFRTAVCQRSHAPGASFLSGPKQPTTRLREKHPKERIEKREEEEEEEEEEEKKSMGDVRSTYVHKHETLSGWIQLLQDSLQDASPTEIRYNADPVAPDVVREDAMCLPKGRRSRRLGKTPSPFDVWWVIHVDRMCSVKHLHHFHTFLFQLLVTKHLYCPSTQHTLTLPEYVRVHLFVEIDEDTSFREGVFPLINECMGLLAFLVPSFEETTTRYLAPPQLIASCQWPVSFGNEEGEREHRARETVVLSVAEDLFDCLSTEWGTTVSFVATDPVDGRYKRAMAEISPSDLLHGDDEDGIRKRRALRKLFSCAEGFSSSGSNDWEEEGEGETNENEKGKGKTTCSILSFRQYRQMIFLLFPLFRPRKRIWPSRPFSHVDLLAITEMHSLWKATSEAYQLVQGKRLAFPSSSLFSKYKDLPSDAPTGLCNPHGHLLLPSLTSSTAQTWTLSSAWAFVTSANHPHVWNDDSPTQTCSLGAHVNPQSGELANATACLRQPAVLSPPPQKQGEEPSLSQEERPFSNPRARFQASQPLPTTERHHHEQKREEETTAETLCWPTASSVGKAQREQAIDRSSVYLFRCMGAFISVTSEQRLSEQSCFLFRSSSCPSYAAFQVSFSRSSLVPWGDFLPDGDRDGPPIAVEDIGKGALDLLHDTGLLQSLEEAFETEWRAIETQKGVERHVRGLWRETRGEETLFPCVEKTIHGSRTTPPWAWTFLSQGERIRFLREEVFALYVARVLLALEHPTASSSFLNMAFRTPRKASLLYPSHASPSGSAWLLPDTPPCADIWSTLQQHRLAIADAFHRQEANKDLSSVTASQPTSSVAEVAPNSRTMYQDRSVFRALFSGLLEGHLLPKVNLLDALESVWEAKLPCLVPGDLSKWNLSPSGPSPVDKLPYLASLYHWMKYQVGTWSASLLSSLDTNRDADTRRTARAEQGDALCSLVQGWRTDTRTQEWMSIWETFLLPHLSSSHLAEIVFDLCVQLLRDLHPKSCETGTRWRAVLATCSVWLQDLLSRNQYVPLPPTTLVRDLDSLGEEISHKHFMHTCALAFYLLLHKARDWNCEWKDIFEISESCSAIEDLITQTSFGPTKVPICYSSPTGFFVSDIHNLALQHVTEAWGKSAVPREKADRNHVDQYFMNRCSFLELHVYSWNYRPSLLSNNKSNKDDRILRTDHLETLQTIRAHVRTIEGIFSRSRHGLPVTRGLTALVGWTLVHYWETVFSFTIEDIQHGERLLSEPRKEEAERKENKRTRNVRVVTCDGSCAPSPSPSLTLAIAESSERFRWKTEQALLDLVSLLTKTDPARFANWEDLEPPVPQDSSRDQWDPLSLEVNRYLDLLLEGQDSFSALFFRACARLLSLFETCEAQVSLQARYHVQTVCRHALRTSLDHSSFCLGDVPPVDVLVRLWTGLHQDTTGFLADFPRRVHLDSCSRPFLPGCVLMWLESWLFDRRIRSASWNVRTETGEREWECHVSHLCKTIRESKCHFHNGTSGEERTSPPAAGHENTSTSEYLAAIAQSCVLMQQGSRYCNEELSSFHSETLSQRRSNPALSPADHTGRRTGRRLDHILSRLDPLLRLHRLWCLERGCSIEEQDDRRNPWAVCFLSQVDVPLLLHGVSSSLLSSSFSSLDWMDRLCRRIDEDELPSKTVLSESFLPVHYPSFLLERSSRTTGSDASVASDPSDDNDFQHIEFGDPEHNRAYCEVYRFYEASISQLSCSDDSGLWVDERQLEGLFSDLRVWTEGRVSTHGREGMYMCRYCFVLVCFHELYEKHRFVSRRDLLWESLRCLELGGSEGIRNFVDFLCSCGREGIFRLGSFSEEPRPDGDEERDTIAEDLFPSWPKENTIPPPSHTPTPREDVPPETALSKPAPWQAHVLRKMLVLWYASVIGSPSSFHYAYRWMEHPKDLPGETYFVPGIAFRLNTVYHMDCGFVVKEDFTSATPRRNRLDPPEVFSFFMFSVWGSLLFANLFSPGFQDLREWTEGPTPKRICSRNVVRNEARVHFPRVQLSSSAMIQTFLLRRVHFACLMLQKMGYDDEDSQLLFQVASHRLMHTAGKRGTGPHAHSRIVAVDHRWDVVTEKERDDIETDVQQAMVAFIRNQRALLHDKRTAYKNPVFHRLRPQFHQWEQLHRRTRSVWETPGRLRSTLVPMGITTFLGETGDIEMDLWDLYEKQLRCITSCVERAKGVVALLPLTELYIQVMTFLNFKKREEEVMQLTLSDLVDAGEASSSAQARASFSDLLRECQEGWSWIKQRTEWRMCGQGRQEERPRENAPDGAQIVRLRTQGDLGWNSSLSLFVDEGHGSLVETVIAECVHIWNKQIETVNREMESLRQNEKYRPSLNHYLRNMVVPNQSPESEPVHVVSYLQTHRRSVRESFRDPWSLFLRNAVPFEFEARTDPALLSLKHTVLNVDSQTMTSKGVCFLKWRNRCLEMLLQKRHHGFFRFEPIPFHSLNKIEQQEQLQTWIRPPPPPSFFSSFSAHDWSAREDDSSSLCVLPREAKAALRRVFVDHVKHHITPPGDFKKEKEKEKEKEALIRWQSEGIHAIRSLCQDVHHILRSGHSNLLSVLKYVLDWKEQEKRTAWIPPSWETRDVRYLISLLKQYVPTLTNEPFLPSPPPDE